MVKFSDRYVKNLKPTDKPFQVRDSKGFALRVLPSGIKTFLFIYEQSGKRKQLRLGVYGDEVTLEEARARYQYAVRALHRGEALVPAAPEPEPEPPSVTTVEAFIKEYLDHCEKDNQTKGWRNSKKYVYNKYLLEWFPRDIAGITRADAIELMRKIQISGISARNAYKMFNVLFEHAVVLELINFSPFSRIPKIFPGMGEVYKDRALSSEEINKLWYRLDRADLPDNVKRILRLVLVTGQRPGEVAGLHQSEIDGDWWTLPPERALKGRRWHRVYLTPLAKELIGDGKGYLFPSIRGDGHVTNITVSESVNSRDSFGLAKWTPHDLRRTARTHMARIGIPDEHAEAILNHAKKGMVRVYNQYMYDDEKKAALLRWEQELRSIIKKPLE